MMLDPQGVLEEFAERAARSEWRDRAISPRQTPHAWTVIRRVVCKHCGRTFQATTQRPNRVYCSRVCSNRDTAKTKRVHHG